VLLEKWAKTESLSYKLWDSLTFEPWLHFAANSCRSVEYLTYYNFYIHTFTFNSCFCYGFVNTNVPLPDSVLLVVCGIIPGLITPIKRRVMNCDALICFHYSSYHSVIQGPTAVERIGGSKDTDRVGASCPLDHVLTSLPHRKLAPNPKDKMER
jgi:hypothetical protein